MEVIYYLQCLGISTQERACSLQHRQYILWIAKAIYLWIYEQLRVFQLVWYMACQYPPCAVLPQDGRSGSGRQERGREAEWAPAVNVWADISQVRGPKLLWATASQARGCDQNTPMGVLGSQAPSLCAHTRGVDLQGGSMTADALLIWIPVVLLVGALERFWLARNRDEGFGCG